MLDVTVVVVVAADDIDDVDEDSNTLRIAFAVST